MNAQAARQINSALVHVWFCLRVFHQAPCETSLSLLSTVTLGQAQSAVEVIEAINANSPAYVEGGVTKRQITSTIAAAALPALLQEAHILWEARRP